MGADADRNAIRLSHRDHRQLRREESAKRDGAINGALYDRDGGDDGIRLSIKVKSMDEVLKGVRALGGNVMHDKMEVPGRGYFAEIGDTEGNVLMLWQDT